MENQFVKVKFFKEDKPHGRAYTYKVPEGELYKVGDLVQINETAIGVVVNEDIDLNWLKTYGAVNIKEILRRVKEDENR